MMGQMYRVLGPPEAGAAGRALRGQQGRLLAVLLLEQGRVVAVSDLVEFVLGKPAPADAAARVQVLVSRLRRHLRDEGLPGRLETVASGYRFECSPDLIDASVFQTVLATQTSGPEGRRQDALEHALELWRGEVADGLGLDAHPVAVRLTELRAAAREELLALQLEGPADAAVLAVAIERSRAWPIRERLVVSTARALYRAGRQNEALALLRDVATTLRDRSGLDPGPALEDLEVAILQHDPALLGSTGSRVGAGRPPATVDELVGRTEERAALRAAFDRARLVTLVGPGGAGKTRLAIEHARGHSDDCWFVDLTTIVAGTDIAYATARAFDLVPDADASIHSLIIDQLRRRRGLLILDNCEHVLSAASHFASQVLSASPTITILATSRERLGVPGEQLVGVSALTPEHQVQLFRNYATAAGCGVDANANDILQVTMSLDGLPLALGLAAARLRSMTLAELSAGLGVSIGYLHTRSPATARHDSLEAVIAWSYDLLTPEERSCLEQLSVFVGSFDRRAATAIVEPALNATDTDRLLSSLVEKSLVAAVPNGNTTRFRLLDTVRQFILRYAPDEELARRHANYFADRLLALPDRRQRSNDHARAVDADFANVRAAFRHAIRTDDLSLAGRIVNSLTTYAEYRPIPEVLDWAETLLDRLGSDDTSVASVQAHLVAGGIGNLMALWPASERHYRAVCNMEEQHPTGHLISALIGLASPLTFLGRPQQALEVAERAVREASASGSVLKRAIARCIWSYATLYAERPDLVDIDELAEEANLPISQITAVYALSAYTCQLLATRSPLAHEAYDRAVSAADAVGHLHMQCFHRSLQAFVSGDDPHAGALIGLRTALALYEQARLPAGPREVASECYAALAHYERWATIATLHGAVPPVSLFTEQARQAKRAAEDHLGAERYRDLAAVGRTLRHEEFARYLTTELDRLGTPPSSTPALVHQ